MSSPVFVLCAVSLALAGCGKTYYFAGRTLPPSGLKNRVMVAVENPAGSGSLLILDAYYDTRNSHDNSIASFSISSYSGSFPSTIQNLPEEQRGAVYSSGDGKLTLIDYANEKGGSTANLNAGTSTSVYMSRNLKYVIAANESSHYLTFLDNGTAYNLNLPGVYKVSLNTSGTLALAFIQNTDDVYTLVHLTASQQTAAANSGDPQHFTLNGQTAQDCEPQTLPIYCAFKVQTSPGISFSRPIKAIFSSDAAYAYILNCGPECGGTQSGITTIPLTPASLNNGTTGPNGLALVGTSTVAIPGGSSNALQNGNTLYVTGQKLMPDGLLSGNLTILNTAAQPMQITTPAIPIADGTHNKMAFADDNTLWIGSILCHQGERGASGGCLTMFNTSTNTVTLMPPYKGDATGLAPITGLHKIYTAEGGQIYIYNTTDGTERDNQYVTVSDVASDITYMDAASDGSNTTY